MVEPEAGKNIALNAGLAFVSGDLVVLTDDDAIPRPDWLVRLRQAADSNPTFGISVAWFAALGNRTSGLAAQLGPA